MSNTILGAYKPLDSLGISQFGCVGAALSPYLSYMDVFSLVVSYDTKTLARVIVSDPSFLSDFRIHEIGVRLLARALLSGVPGIAEAMNRLPESFKSRIGAVALDKLQQANLTCKNDLVQLRSSLGKLSVRTDAKDIPSEDLVRIVSIWTNIQRAHAEAQAEILIAFFQKLPPECEAFLRGLNDPGLPLLSTEEKAEKIREWMPAVMGE